MLTTVASNGFSIYFKRLSNFVINDIIQTQDGAFYLSICGVPSAAIWGRLFKQR